MTPHQTILIAGPTASGKSALALRLAERTGGVIINADSMQVYRELRLLTARPTVAEEAAIPHRLYGHISAAEAYSVGRYVADVARTLDELQREGRRAIIVGGTGLYFKALIEGLSPIPAIPIEIRQRWRALEKSGGVAAVRAALQQRDATMAARLDPNDGQRIVRALEVQEATGKSLADWQAIPGKPIIVESETVRLIVTLDREALVERCDLRFDQMMEEGALEEARGLAAQRLSVDLPAMRALGVRPLLRHLAGEIDLEPAIQEAKIETRQYTKRQMTWLSRNMIAWRWINTQEMKKLIETDFAFIDS
jgi:tRNA dimethylallyltransferase